MIWRSSLLKAKAHQQTSGLIYSEIREILASLGVKCAHYASPELLLVLWTWSTTKNKKSPKLLTILG